MRCLLDRIADELTSTLLVSNSLYSLRSLYYGYAIGVRPARRAVCGPRALPSRARSPVRETTFFSETKISLNDAAAKHSDDQHDTHMHAAPDIVERCGPPVQITRLLATRLSCLPRNRGAYASGLLFPGCQERGWRAGWVLGLARDSIPCRPRSLPTSAAQSAPMTSFFSMPSPRSATTFSPTSTLPPTGARPLSPCTSSSLVRSNFGFLSILTLRMYTFCSG